ncbi:hypothetical protein N8862_03050 [Pseudomonadales bacterium]|nr:hypothetical protein [Pseudomonadales bacterium]
MRKLATITLMFCCGVFSSASAFSYEPNIDFGLWAANSPNPYTTPRSTTLNVGCLACKTEEDLLLYAAGVLQREYGVNTPIIRALKVIATAPGGRSVQATVALRKSDYCLYIICWTVANEAVWDLEYSTHDHLATRKKSYFVTVIKARYAALKKAHDVARKAKFEARERERELQRQRARGSNNFYYGNEYPDYSDRPFGLTINSIGELGWGAGFGSWSGSY